MSDSVQFCRICGLANDDNPYGATGNEPSYSLCPCCNVEHGYEDYTVESALAYRKTWLAAGGEFVEPRFKPQNWSLPEQLKNIPTSYL
ncbi:hypothetical protein [Hymenobacter sp. APR13]|uniref:hypothetical protein n=1 Tax=Hymenobacter sp. APR13 TaxID=1356852 RepID=UPI00090059C3|nr:hypothetical protein [Hymenobacter sp. APR13]